MAFKSYCWCLGTTSFRVKELNLKIEKQLTMLKTLWEENSQKSWQGVQERYYDLMKETGFIKGNAKRKDKDARQKTSGLVNIGLLTEERKITPVGQTIVDIVANADFKDNNIFEINKDSYIYLKQLLKYQQYQNGCRVKPMAVLIYLIEKLGFLTKEEFTYVMPLCISNQEVDETLEQIKKLRNNETNLYNIITDKMFSKDNYIEALNYMNNNDINTLDKFCVIDMNRKSIKYSKPYYEFYKNLYRIVNSKLEEDEVEIIVKFIRHLSSKNSKVAKGWKNYFHYTARERNFDELKNNILKADIFKCKELQQYNKEFFKILHYSKWIATLDDYSDLNKRYFSLTDIFLFQDNKVQLDLIPKYYFEDICDRLVKENIIEDDQKYRDLIENDIALTDIYDFMTENIQSVIDKANKTFESREITIYNIKGFVKDERIKRFNQIIDELFTKEQLIMLFQKLNSKNAGEVQDYIDWEADIPTIFEYLLAIAWYRISGKEGNILEFMRLSLNADLLPKSHASGGEADIVYKYPKKATYDKHDLLLEATLTESSTQRRNEMEPVSRHIMHHIQETGNPNDYVVFVANILNQDVLSDFRGRKNHQYYSKQQELQTGLKIIPLSIENIIKILECNINYENLYQLFDVAYKDTTSNNIEWYEEQIACKIK